MRLHIQVRVASNMIASLIYIDQVSIEYAYAFYAMR